MTTCNLCINITITCLGQCVAGWRVASWSCPSEHQSVLVLLVSGELHLDICRVWGAILELVLVRETAWNASYAHVGGRGLGATQAGKLRIPDLIAGFVCLQTVSMLRGLSLIIFLSAKRKHFTILACLQLLSPPLRPRKGLMSTLCTYYGLLVKENICVFRAPATLHWIKSSKIYCYTFSMSSKLLLKISLTWTMRLSRVITWPGYWEAASPVRSFRVT